MTRAPKLLSRAEALAEIDQIRRGPERLEHVQANEWIAPVKAARWDVSHGTAIRRMRQLQRLGKLWPPSLRRTRDGRRVWAWRPRGRLAHTCGQCGSKLDKVRPGKWQCPACG